MTIPNEKIIEVNLLQKIHCHNHEELMQRDGYMITNYLKCITLNLRALQLSIALVLKILHSARTYTNDAFEVSIEITDLNVANILQTNKEHLKTQLYIHI